MTDRVYGFHVLLDGEYRIDDIQPIIDAVMMMKHVKHVDIHISTSDTWMARTNAMIDMKYKLLQIAKDLTP